MLTRLCRALDAAGDDEAVVHLANLLQLLERRRQALADLEAQLTFQLTELAHDTEISS
jgi:MerR family mercuric resistance operon transcriptional regulator